MSLKDKTKKWLAKNCIPSLQGKTVLITGANSGIGFKEAELVLYLGGKVIMACRNPEKAKSAAGTLKNEYRDASIVNMQLDLADFSSIDRFAEELSNEGITPDMFVNNAGVFHQPKGTTVNGMEIVIGTNYFGSVYLSEKIVPYMAEQRNPSIYVNTISMIHKIGTVDYDDFYYEKKYGHFRAYARSKICLAKYTYDLALKYHDSSVRVMMNHPGMSITPMGLNAYGKIAAKLSVPVSCLMNSPEKSALSVPYMLSHNFEPGSIIGPNILFGGWGYPAENHVYTKVKKGADELLTFTKTEIEQHR